MDTAEQKKQHEARAERVKAAMPDEASLKTVGARFKLLGEVSRLKILAALKEGELCVEHICEVTGAAQSATSHQLRILRDNGFLRSRREGQSVLYSLADEHVAEMMEMGFLHAECGGKR